MVNAEKRNGENWEGKMESLIRMNKQNKKKKTKQDRKIQARQGIKKLI